jgi:hypothetical protein
MTANLSNSAAHTRRDETRRANPAGAYVMTGGAIVFLIATFMNWVNVDGNTYSGYEVDSLIPFTAYLGLGFGIALLYAAKRATRRQHRGLSLSAMAAGVAATGLALSYLIDTPGAAERGSNWDTEVGIYIAIIGALVWTIGSLMLANEPEGDVEHESHDDYDRRTDAGLGGAGN